MSDMTLIQVEMRLSQLRSQYEQGRGRLALLTQQRSEKEFSLAETRQSIDTWRQVQVLFTKVSEFARQQTKMLIEQGVTAALQAILGDDDIRFEVLIREIGNKPAADWAVVSAYADIEVSNTPEDSRGGGVVDIVSLALRLALLELSRPKPGGPVMLDEAGKHVSAEYAPNMAAFLKGYAQRTGRQIVLVTHQAPLAEVADRSYRVSKNARGISEVRALG